MFKNLVPIGIATGGALVWNLLIPILQQQKQEWFGKPWVLRLTLGVVVLCFVPLGWQATLAFYGVVRSLLGDYPRLALVTVICAGAMVGGVLAGMGYYLFSGTVVDKDQAAALKPEPEHTPSPPLNAGVSVQYIDTALPVPLPPHDTTYIVQLHPQVMQFVKEMRNDSSKMIFYPPKPNSPPDRLFMCELENHNNDDFVDIRLMFQVGYYESDNWPFKEVLNKDGTRSVTVNKPPGIPVELVQKGGKTVKAIKQGRLLTVQQREIALRTIRSHGSVKLYFINYSSLWASFTFPTEVTAMIGGNVQRVPVTLIRPPVNPLDTNYLFPVAPARYEWKEIFPPKKSSGH